MQVYQLQAGSNQSVQNTFIPAINCNKSSVTDASEIVHVVMADRFLLEPVLFSVFEVI